MYFEVWRFRFRKIPLGTGVDTVLLLSPSFCKVRGPGVFGSVGIGGIGGTGGTGLFARVLTRGSGVTGLANFEEGPFWPNNGVLGLERRSMVAASGVRGRGGIADSLDKAILVFRGDGSGIELFLRPVVASGFDGVTAPERIPFVYPVRLVLLDALLGGGMVLAYGESGPRSSEDRGLNSCMTRETVPPFHRGLLRATGMRRTDERRLVSERLEACDSAGETEPSSPDRHR